MVAAKALALLALAVFIPATSTTLLRRMSDAPAPAAATAAPAPPPAGPAAPGSETWEAIDGKKEEVTGQGAQHDIDKKEGATENGRGPNYDELAERVAKHGASDFGPKDFGMG